MAVGLKHGVPVETSPPEEQAEASAVAVLTPAHAQEITRYGAVEIHNISSLMGGIVAQVIAFLIPFIVVVDEYWRMIMLLVYVYS